MAASRCPHHDASRLPGTGGPLVLVAPWGHPFIWATTWLCDRGLLQCEPVLAHIVPLHLAASRRPLVMSAALSTSDVTASYDAVVPHAS